MTNPTLNCDGYKLGHRAQYPDGTERVQSNWTPRTSRIEGQQEVYFLGLQYFLQKELGGWEDFFISDIDAVCTRYTNRVNGYLGPNSVGDEHLRDLHTLGYLPLEFRAVPEGSAVPIGVPQLIVENTDDQFGWLVNYFETILSTTLWMPCTSATTASRLRKILDRYAGLTGSPQEFVDWQGHDFSFRGMAGLEAACMSGMGHLAFFTGTDTIPALEFIETYYGRNLPTDYFIGGSVSATEHSVMCAGGELSELETFDRLLSEVYPTGILSVVSDTWDLWKVLTEVLPQLHAKITAREGKLVIRPDSGDPVKIVCGDPDADVDSPAFKGVIELLWEVFGGDVNEKGFKVLDQHIGCIYGDSINDIRMEAICAGLAHKGFASCNMVFGVGSFSYQFVTRDTYGFAMKATWVQINGKGHDIFKDPVTDNGVKKSAKGRLAVLRNGDGGLYLVNQATEEQEKDSVLKVVWRDGAFLRYDSFDKIRERALASL